MTDYMVDLNALDKDGEVECPYCMKIVSFSYGASGKQSCQCGNCHRFVLIDYATRAQGLQIVSYH